MDLKRRVKGKGSFTENDDGLAMHWIGLAVDVRVLPHVCKGCRKSLGSETKQQQHTYDESGKESVYPAHDQCLRDHHGHVALHHTHHALHGGWVAHGVAGGFPSVVWVF